MECSNCRFHNPEGAKFCVECGNKIEKICPKCDSRNSPNFKFCSECGQKFDDSSEPLPNELSFDEKLDKIQRYLPKGITEKILSQRGKIEGEKRHVTVMFCDIEGFTSLVEQIGAEDAYSIMDQIYELLIHKVHDYEGTVNEMTGDGVMALFGAPIALEDAPQRAVSSAISIHREMIRFKERLKQEKVNLPPIQMRIGIHTGFVVVGTLGNNLRVEFKAVGDTVNTAARMEQLAEAGTTYVTVDTFKLTEGYFRFEALGEKEIKGKEKPLRVYRVIAPSRRRSRFDVSAERGLTPFVGRQRELELVLDGYERAKEGRGQAISIISEAGIGKSRLLYEFRKVVSNEDVTFLEGRCLSYSRNVAYHPVADLFRANFDIQDSDREQEIKEKVAKGLQFMGVDEASVLPYLLELLSVKESGINKIYLTPEGRKERTLEAIKKIVLKGSEIRPLIMAIEDLHWMDRSSEDVIKEILKIIAGAKVFLIFSFRPEFVHTWGRRSYHSQVTLNRLSNRETLSMAAYILGVPHIESDLEDLILRKTEGLPFFIEEFVKSLKDFRIIERKDNLYRLSKDLEKLSIPSTIQNVIMARVDALPEGAKEVLRTGSVIEREFSHYLIKIITGRPEQELLSYLSTLKDTELLYERGIYPDSTYIFKHALTREVVYDSILSKKKKHLHEKIATTLEEIYKEDICYHYGGLVDHCIASENYEKAAKYASLEARRYQKAALFEDAIEYAKRSVNCWEQLSLTEANQKKLIDARTALSIYYLSLNLHAQAREAVEPILNLALKLNYRKRLPAIYTSIGLHYLWDEEDIHKGLELIEKATTIAEENGDFPSLWMALYQSSSFLSIISEFKDAHKRLTQCLDFSLTAKNPLGIAFAKGSISSCYIMEGKLNLAYKFASEALKLSQETEDAFIKSMAYSIYGSTCYAKGFFEEAKSILLEWTSLYEKVAPLAWALWNYVSLGWIHIWLSEYDDAVNCFRKIINKMETVNYMPSTMKYIQSCLMKAKVLRHDNDVELGEVLACYQDYKVTWGKGWTAGNIGNILLNIDDEHHSKAGVWFQRAIEEDDKNGFRWCLAEDYASYGNWFKKEGDIKGARKQLTKAIKIFRECGAVGWVKKYEDDRATLTR
jgi:class 3 adenylate cyclase/tetratricopeptide (TPR) repeat protein